jgi:xylulose-5-phosphate/fructose-6-phosphate phosphoketolase
MVVLNDLDRFHLVMDAANRVPALASKAEGLKREMTEMRSRHRDYIREKGEDLPDVRNWRWSAS